ncbi:DUF2059 domain-containing protein [Methylobacterium gnaphalii]|uniref:DUF2059 domain-containing protein n=1 Tax=Methylobacterium gnaphalii TaxID=1010610 RepID=A0A512JGL7_9HYPH|nr:DUF2059 domain-containing protein [Methylobacterium gnaphalii]GEP09101.1 hypothetical protein MGN01_09460 [Methylobacterium gnaphalii]GJD68414.1 hypothetical protein MMMDOFMJ_1337 [Methylobacterium gnaphalii]GLS49025.1 hypothetical protein GCM10007885_18720 [Methylobacterium gnaphalii]
MRSLVLAGLFSLGICLSPALAQPGAPPQVAADPERLAAAKEVVAAAQGDRAAVMAAMKTPMIGMMQQMGIKEADRAQVMVDEVVLPTLASHYDDLLSVQALAFAAVLSKEDLKAVAAFYGTPAGKNMVKAQPQLSQAMLTGMQQWIGSLAPELREKIAKAAQAHGWDGKSAKP